MLSQFNSLAGSLFLRIEGGGDGKLVGRFNECNKSFNITIIYKHFVTPLYTFIIPLHSELNPGETYHFLE